MLKRNKWIFIKKKLITGALSRPLQQSNFMVLKPLNYRPRLVVHCKALCPVEKRECYIESGKTAKRWFSSKFWYNTESSLPVICHKATQTITLPPPNLTILLLSFGLNSVFAWRPTKFLLTDTYKLNLDLLKRKEFFCNPTNSNSAIWL